MAKVYFSVRIRVRPNGGSSRLGVARDPDFECGIVVTVKMALEVPDDLLQKTEASAASCGESLGDDVTHALRAHSGDVSAAAQSKRGWRSVFGKAEAAQVSDIDRIVAEEFERIDPDSWR